MPLPTWCRSTYLACGFAGIAIITGNIAVAAEPAATAQPSDSYQSVAQERADKLVRILGLQDPTALANVKRAIADHYLAIHRIDDARTARLKAIKDDAAIDKEAKMAQTDKAREQAMISRYEWHFEFQARLSTLLSPEQIDKVKDGLTYGVLPLTYRVYQEMYPQLSAEQKNQILAWLTEAREHAIDGGSSEEKHGWFGKYKGRINNYLSAAGFDAKKAEAEFTKKMKEPPRNDSAPQTSSP